jgi:cell wall-associated NlpC family hydrolase
MPECMCSSLRRLGAGVLIVSGIGTGGCTSVGAVPRPSAFPTVSNSPASIPPTALAASRAPDPSELIRTATELRGVPYQLGGDSPSAGFDCSGFVRYVFSLNHVELPRTVIEQYGVGSRVGVNDIREGDLVFFSTNGPGASHVGLAIGNAEFIHAPGVTGAVRVERLDVAYWHNRVVGVKRLF